MALDAAAAAADPPQIPVVGATAVALEARRSAAAMKNRRNETDLASTLVHVQRLREENRRPNTRSTYSKCWRLWRVSAGPWQTPPLLPFPAGVEWSDADGAGQDWCTRRGWED